MRILFLSLLMAFMVFAGFQASVRAEEPAKVTSEDVKKQAEQTWSTAKEYTLQEKQEYQKRIESQLADLSQRIDELKEKAKTAKQDAVVKLQAQMEALKKQKEVAEQKLSELRSSTSNAWGEVKDGVDKAMDNLKKAYENARSYFP